jgi:hypothetical protein
MSLYKITDLAGLHRHLHAAMQLEHATIPPYLTALYSIRPGTNVEAFRIIRAVAVEEMLHLTLVGNILNAVGGRPALTAPGFVPRYPAFLPDGETDFSVSCERFSKHAIETFLKIERPASLAHVSANTHKRPRRAGSLKASHAHEDSEEHFFSIGEFYRAIEDGLDLLHAEMGDALFKGDPKRQITPDYYYSGGGGLIAVTDLASAKAAMELIAEQGEGITDHIFDEDGEIAHYYRFQQLVLGRYYQQGDTHGAPSGGTVAVDWDAVYPIKANASLADYPEGSDGHAEAMAFNTAYGDFLGLLDRAFDGEPQLFIEAVGGMFQLKERFNTIMRQPIAPGAAEHGAPTFEIGAR